MLLQARGSYRSRNDSVLDFFKGEKFLSVDFGAVKDYLRVINLQGKVGYVPKSGAILEVVGLGTKEEEYSFIDAVISNVIKPDEEIDKEALKLLRDLYKLRFLIASYGPDWSLSINIKGTRFNRATLNPFVIGKGKLQYPNGYRDMRLLTPEDESTLNLTERHSNVDKLDDAVFKQEISPSGSPFPVCAQECAIIAPKSGKQRKARSGARCRNLKTADTTPPRKTSANSDAGVSVKRRAGHRPCDGHSATSDGNGEVSRSRSSKDQSACNEEQAALERKASLEDISYCPEGVYGDHPSRVDLSLAPAYLETLETIMASDSTQESHSTETVNSELVPERSDCSLMESERGRNPVDVKVRLFFLAARAVSIKLREKEVGYVVKFFSKLQFCARLLNPSYHGDAFMVHGKSIAREMTSYYREESRLAPKCLLLRVVTEMVKAEPIFKTHLFCANLPWALADDLAEEVSEEEFEGHYYLKKAIADLLLCLLSPPREMSFLPSQLNGSFVEGLLTVFVNSCRIESENYDHGNCEEFLSTAILNILCLCLRHFRFFEAMRLVFPKHQHVGDILSILLDMSAIENDNPKLINFASSVLKMVLDMIWSTWSGISGEQLKVILKSLDGKDISTVCPKKEHIRAFMHALGVAVNSTCLEDDTRYLKVIDRYLRCLENNVSYLKEEEVGKLRLLQQFLSGLSASESSSGRRKNVPLDSAVQGYIVRPRRRRKSDRAASASASPQKNLALTDGERSRKSASLTTVSNYMN